MSVSIILPGWNEAACLGRRLANLEGLNPPPDEVVLVDGGSGDRTLAIARTYGDRLPLTIVESPTRGRSV